MGDIDTSKQLIPALRFKKSDGSAYPDWQVKKLGEVLTAYSSKIAINKIKTISYGYPVYGASGLVGYIDYYEQDRDYIAIIKDGSNVGKIFYYLKNSSVVGTLQYLVSDNSNIKFLYYHLTMIDFRKYILGATIPHIYYKNYSKEKLPLPCLEEQEKIAKFLASIDAKINLISLQLDTFYHYKKALLQQLFPHHTSLNPNLRFLKDNGSTFPTWEIKKLDEILEFLPTNSLSREKLNYISGKTYNIHYGDIHTKYKSYFNINQEYVPFINLDIEINKSPSYCQEGDLIIADASEDYKDIGKSIELINLNNMQVVAGLHTLLARDINNNTIKGFKGYLMQSNNIKQQLIRLATGISVLGISKSNIKKIHLPLPCLQEQLKIANLLSALDNKIYLNLQKLKAYQLYKKALLQQLFPYIP